MKQKLCLLLVALNCFSAWSQLQVQNTQTAQELVLNSFLGENITVSNIKFNGSATAAQTIRDQIGTFTGGMLALGSEQGLILATGKISVAQGPNNSPSKSSDTAMPFAGDADLALISGATVMNVCNLEFDFIPNGDTLFFEYIFASEEYPEYAGSSFNDTFGLLLSGPGISGPFSNGAKNIAIVPNSSNPVGINYLNNGTTNIGPCVHCAYYLTNGSGTTPALNDQMQYDGHSTVLTASSNVLAGQTYHLKFIIANVMDNTYDSAMFLIQSSLRSATLGTKKFETEIVKIAPNPADDFIQINSAIDIKEVKCYDFQGRILKQIKTHGTSVNIEIADLQSGTYFMAITTADEKTITQKIMVR